MTLGFLRHKKAIASGQIFLLIIALGVLVLFCVLSYPYLSSAPSHEALAPKVQQQTQLEFGYGQIADHLCHVRFREILDHLGIDND